MNRTRAIIAILGMITALAVGVGVAPAGAAGNGVDVARPYLEHTFNTPTVGPCDTTDPTRRVCDFRLDGYLISTHIGRAEDHGVGTLTFHLATPCTTGDGRLGLPMTGNFEGIIIAADGSQLSYAGAIDACLIDGGPDPDTSTTGWWVTGGTGRFDGASGQMTSTIDMSFGTLVY